MEAFRKELRFNVPSRRALINITPDVPQCIAESGIKECLAKILGE